MNPLIMHMTFFFKSCRASSFSWNSHRQKRSFPKKSLQEVNESALAGTETYPPAPKLTKAPPGGREDTWLTGYIAKKLDAGKRKSFL